MDANNSSVSGRRERRSKGTMDQLQLTDEERKVLAECRKNSMIRGVPAGILSALLTGFAVRSGRFPHLIRWSRLCYGGNSDSDLSFTNVWARVIYSISGGLVSFLGGLVVGVASYRNTCLEKIMQLENSVLADQVREYYKRAGIDFIGPQHKKSTEFDDSTVSAGYGYSPESDPHSSNENISQSFRPVSEESKWRSSNELQDNTLEGGKHTSFEELRQQNRQKQVPRQYPVRSSQNWDVAKEDRQFKQKDQGHDQYSPRASSDWQAQGSGEPKRRNKYGDPIE